MWPENTLAAFRGALELGIQFLETDVHLTRDGILVAHHDDTVDRTTNGSGKIRDLLYSEIARFDAGYRFTEDGKTFPARGKGLKIPMLDEVFGLSPVVRVNVEIKPPGKAAAKKLWEFVDRKSLYDRILVAATEDIQVRRFRRYSSERVATAASRREALVFWMATRAHVSRFLPAAYDALQVPATQAGLTVVDRNFIVAAHRHGIQVHVWTVDESPEIRRLLNLGVDGIMSDRPDRLAALPTFRTPDSLRPLPM
jgi:glycerophosphoryl diester phosphodiesterase